MVDAYACVQFNRSERIYLRPLTVTDPINRINHQRVHRHHIHGGNGHRWPSVLFPRPPPPPPPGPPRGPPGRNRIELWDDHTGHPHIVQASKGRLRNEDQTALTEEQLLICAPFVRGYSLKTKEWSEYCKQMIGIHADRQQCFLVSKT
jgi:hypothetical protein